MGVFVGELAAWLVWVVLLPAIMWLAVRFPPVGPRVGRNAVLHVVAGLVVAVLPLLGVIITRSFLPGPQPPRMGDPQFWTVLMQSYIGNSIASMFVYGTMVGLVLAWTYHREEQERRARESQLAATLARTERDLLRMQIHPHFLFNTLHAINALVVDDPRGARSMVARLSDLLRLSLDDDARHEVTLEEEVEFLAHSIEIQQIRFRDWLTIIENIEPEALPKLVPRLLLQPLLENAIQHGIAQKEEGGMITIAARLDGDMLVIEIADDGPGPRPELVGRPARVRASGCATHRRDDTQRILALLEALHRRESYLDRLPIKQGDRTFLQPLETIDWIEANGKHVNVHVGKDTHVIRDTMAQVSEILNPERFVRISRSAIVNVARIREIQPWFRGEYVVLLHSGAQVPSTRAFRDNLSRLLDRRR